MKISDKGFITIPRALIASSNWQEKRCFTVIEAYIDLQLMAYFGRTPTVHKINNCEVTLTKGQLCTTLKFLAERWGCSMCRVRYLLKKFCNMGLSRVDSTKKYSVITVAQAFEFVSPPTVSTPISTAFSTNNKKSKKEEERNLTRTNLKTYSDHEDSPYVQSPTRPAAVVGTGLAARRSAASPRSGYGSYGNRSNGYGNGSNGYGSYGTKQDALGEALAGFAARQAGYIASMDGEEPDF